MIRSLGVLAPSDSQIALGCDDQFLKIEGIVFAVAIPRG
jgi:hypothetical protein